MICSTCANILQQCAGLVRRDEESLLFLHHASAAQLAAAADAGCRFCDPFWSKFSLESQQSLLDSDQSFANHDFGINVPDLDDQSEEANKIRADHTDCYFTSYIIFPHNTWFGTDIDWELLCSISLASARTACLSLSDKTYAASPVLFILLPTDATDLPEKRLDSPSGGRDLPAPKSNSSTDSPEAWSVAQQWIQTCVTSHTKCNRNANTTWYPTRLLKIQDSSIQVIESREEACVGPYMTLSHRWGSFRPQTLNPSTYTTLHHPGILITDLPAAFQDAVEICQRLRIPYLWIDCLCILQDPTDLSDWIREASFMNKVYTHSFLNLSSLACQDSSSNLFRSRDPSLLLPAFISTNLHGFDLSLQKPPQSLEIVNLTSWQHDLTTAPLNLRAWVLQERLLSPRVLHFGKKQLLWECLEHDASETYPGGLPPIMRKNMQSRFKSLDPELFFSGTTRTRALRCAPEEGIYHVWARIVEAYSACGLSYAGDKLIAVAGIAKFMRESGMKHQGKEKREMEGEKAEEGEEEGKEEQEEEYVAGMWRKDLVAELLWSVDKDTQMNGEKACRAEIYRAPTFAWASVDGIIHAGKPEGGRAFIEVVDVKLEYVTDDVTGLVKDGVLTLRCRLQEVVFKRHPTLSDFKLLVINGVEVREDEGPEWKRLGPQVMLDEHEETFNPIDQKPGSLFGAPAMVSADDAIFSSLLFKLVDREKGTYARIGLVKSYLQNGRDIDPGDSKVRQVLQSRSEHVASLPCVSFDGDMHTIRVI